MSRPQPVLIAGRWRAADAADTFQAFNPSSGQPLPELFPLSRWSDCDAALTSAAAAADEMAGLPGAALAAFLRGYADRIEAAADPLCALAHAETGYPVSPRLKDVELPRTVSQLRQAAEAAADGSWKLPTIDTRLGIRSCLAPLGPVCVFGPNNFPFAFGSISGGDFAAAIAAGNPVIAKANTSHPATTRLFAVCAHEAARAAALPDGAVQLLYRTSHEVGCRLVADPRLGATAYTGSRAAGLKLKAAADAAGKPIYLELSSINPVVVLPGALVERPAQVADDFVGSCLMGSGQFCTNPGLVLLLAGQPTERFLAQVVERFAAAPVAPLLSRSVADALALAVERLHAAGAEVLCGGRPHDGPGFRYANTLLRVTASRFLADPHTLGSEAFGNASLCVVADDVPQLIEVLKQLEGNLTGCVYSDSAADEPLYQQIVPHLRRRVGRLLNDKMPTGVAVSPAMNHGGPFPATGHPGFTAVGIPAALRRLAMLECYDNVRPHRLPPELQDPNPNGRMWRLIDGVWTQADVSPAP